jgi:hypothetical protein
MTTYTTIAAGKLLNFDRSKPDPRDLLEVSDENGNELSLTVDEASEFSSMTGIDLRDLLSPEIFHELIEWLSEEDLLESDEKLDPKDSTLAKRSPGLHLDEQYRTAAKDTYHQDGSIEIDDHAIVSHSEEGAYVQAWVWIDQWQVDPEPSPKKP